MSFTGILGGGTSILGSIVFGLSLGSGPLSFGYVVHVLTSKTVRVAFDFKVNIEEALKVSNYVLTAVSPGTAYLPSIESIVQYEEGGFEIELKLSKSLTLNEIYTLEILSVPSADGSGFVSSAGHNFVANVPDPPKAIGSYLSKRGYIDIVFDRPVGRFSLSPLADLADSSIPGPGISMTPVPWGPTIPDTNLRFQVPVVAGADQWVVNYSNVIDESLNIGSSQIPVSVPETIPRPLTQAQILTNQFIDVSSSSYNEIYKTTNVRVYFSGPQDPTSASNISNWSAFQCFTHFNTDTVNIVTAADAFDLATLLILLNDIKSRFNLHRIEPEVHYSDDNSNVVTSTNAVDSTTAANLLNELQHRYISHSMTSDAERYHSASDPVNTIIFAEAIPAAIAANCVIANALKVAYNGHIVAEYPLNFVSLPVMGEIEAGFSTYGNVPNKCEYNWFVDLRVESSSPKARIRIKGTIDSEDLGSTTNNTNYTGNIISRSSNSIATKLNTFITPDSRVSFSTDKEVSFFPNSFPGILLPSGEKSGSSTSRFTDLQSAYWALIELWVIYDYHRTGQSHPVTDIYNYMTPSDKPSADVSSMITSANTLLQRFIAHRTDRFHTHQDPVFLSEAPAIDENSLITLIENLCITFDEHSMNFGMHNSSLLLRSAPLFNSITFETGMVLNQAELFAQDKIQTKFTDLRIPEKIGVITDLNYPFIGISDAPVIAQAVPRTGISQIDNQRRYMSDEVQIFFSKVMEKDSLDIVTITGGSLIVKSGVWSTTTKANIVVADMQPITYTVSATGLKDIAGNVIV